MKGAASIIVTMILVLIVFSAAMVFFFGSNDTTEDLKTGIEEKEKAITTGIGANFKIINITFDEGDYTKSPNVTIMNNGQSNLNVEELHIYLNNTKFGLTHPYSGLILEPGETAILHIVTI